jgi:hypothetical protein
LGSGTVEGALKNTSKDATGPALSAPSMARTENTVGLFARGPRL